MNESELRATVLDALASIAPEAASAALDAKRSLREQLDIDSVDFLNLLTTLHQRLGIDIPEADYAQMQTLDAMTAYLARKLDAARR
ncbi:phosphopantetheine-binding protein [Fontimonas sp. SYSU GA230001]|uniref:acyl carrier protein n=1 Tax=Fontimonas sp. SYSU GA230001 TaxID=3142450 RepID=UPI0032B3F245